MPHYEELLEIVDLRAQASETSCATPKKKLPNFIRCQYKFLRQQLCCLQNREASAVRLWLLPHDDKVSVLKTNNLCTNCLTGGHFKRQCKSIHKCKVCQKPHHTLLHVDQQNPARPAGSQPATPVSSNAAMKLKSNALLMTCHVSVIAPDGSSVEARALLDNASSASFVSERLVQSLSLPPYIPLVVCHKGPLSSQFPTSKFHPLDPTKEK